MRNFAGGGGLFYGLMEIWGGVFFFPDHSNLFSKLEPTIFKYLTLIKIKASMTCVLQRVQMKIAKMKFCLAYNIKGVI